MTGLLTNIFGANGATGGGLLGQKLVASPPSSYGLGDRDTRVLMGAAMMGGKSIGEQLGGALNVLGTRRLEGRKINRTLEWLKANNPDLAQAVESGALDPTQAAEMAWRERTAKPKTTEYQDRAAAAQQYGIDPNSPQGRAFILSGKYGDPTGGQPERALSGIPMQDSNGNWYMGQLDSTGGLTPAKMPDGFTVASPYDKAASTAQGKAEGVVRAALPTAKLTAETTIKQIDAVMNDPNLNAAVGPVDGLFPSFRAGSRQFDERVKQLQGDAFLQARQMLKGGGQITDYEGQRAENAMARLSQAKSETDFKLALQDFRDAVEIGYQKLEAAYGGAGGGADYNPQGAGDGGVALDPETAALVRQYGGK